MKPRLDINFTLRQQLHFLFGRPYMLSANEFLVNHCRSAIVLALKVLNFPQGTGVGVMIYNCHTIICLSGKSYL